MPSFTPHPTLRPLTATALAWAALLSSCGGSGDDAPAADGGKVTPSATHVVGGTLTGLASTTRLSLSLGSETLTLNGDGSFEFSTPVADQASYTVQLSARPVGQHCTLSGASGTATADVRNVSVSCEAPAYAVMYAFGAHNTAVVGSAPWGELVQASDGQLYGLAMVGGNLNAGTAFRLALDGSYTLLHSFGSDAIDGASPLGSLSLATDGTLWGTTGAGGYGNQGTVFQMATDGVMLQRISVGSADNPYIGRFTNGRLLQWPDGRWLGLNQNGGLGNVGTVFIAGGSDHAMAMLSAFDSSNSAGPGSPTSGLALGPDGQAWGTTRVGGLYQQGTLYKVSISGVLTVLHHFGDPSVTHDGTQPGNGALLLAQDGQLYGTTSRGGTADEGTVYRVSPAGQVTVLHAFGSGVPAQDGQRPVAGLIQGSDGHFYGATASGGRYGLGTLFKMDSAGNVTVLHDFADPAAGNDGFTPVGGLLQGQDGLLYGTTRSGGTGGGGTVYCY
jgi:uncharacterized repeat protein (TIGR03803 family)